MDDETLEARLAKLDINTKPWMVLFVGVFVALCVMAQASRLRRLLLPRDLLSGSVSLLDPSAAQTPKRFLAIFMRYPRGTLANTERSRRAYAMAGR